MGNLCSNSNPEKASKVQPDVQDAILLTDPDDI